MRRLDAAEVDLAIRAYLAHIPMREIASHLGVSRQAIWHQLKKAGIQREGKQSIPCRYCGNPVQRNRSQLRRTRWSYCSRDCYIATVRTPDYVASRQGQRVARAVAAQHFPALAEDNVVHHIDGNQTHNWPENLMVFRHQADHMRWHRGDRESSGVVPLWRGDC